MPARSPRLARRSPTARLTRGPTAPTFARPSRRSPPADLARAPYSARVAAQDARFHLPELATTTIGSFPQTPEIRKARAAWAKGDIDDAAYEEAMKAEIASVVELQESLGLDVLVHGEAERNDMVQYFAELLDGFDVTVNGWVQSYGSRCTRPSILWGDVARPEPMTVKWAEVRAVALRQARQGHAHRTGDDPCLVVRSRRPAARRDREPGGARASRGDSPTSRLQASASSRWTSPRCASCFR